MKALLFNIQKFSLHDGLGIRTTVFFKGCNLRCAWCANPESQSLQPEPMRAAGVGSHTNETFAGYPLAGRWYTLEEVVREVLKDKAFYDQSGGGVTLSGGEPMLQPDFVSAFSSALHEAGVTVGIETALHVQPEVCRRVLGGMDFACIDLKHWNNEKHREGTGAGNELIISNLREALSTPLPVFVRIPVIPGYNDSLADAQAFGSLLMGLGAKEIHLLPFHQMGEEKYNRLDRSYGFRHVPPLHEEDLEAYAEALRAGGFHVQIGG